MLTTSRITSFSKAFLDLRIEFECSGNVSKYLKAYRDLAGIWTIGIGTTYYPNGSRVKEGDVCTLEQAYNYAAATLSHLESFIDSTTPDTITQGQFDAIGDFIYNDGEGAWKGSTLRKLVAVDPNDFAHIQNAFYAWDKAHVNGKLVEVDGLLRRRKCEYYLYKNGVNHPTFFKK